MNGNIKHIVIIESIGNERKTGSELYEDCVKRNIEYRKSTITHNILKPNSKNELIEVLKYYENNASSINGGLLLHFEMHGDEDLNGLFLADDTIITWEELNNLLRPINIINRNKLYISLATCNGRNLHQWVKPNLKSPYSCIISASQEVFPDEIINQFELLFEKLIETGNLVEAYLYMESRETKFYYKDSYELFEMHFKQAEIQLLNDPIFKNEILEETRLFVQKEGLEMPTDLESDIKIKASIRNLYELQKKTFDFSKME